MNIEIPESVVEVRMKISREALRAAMNAEFCGVRMGDALMFGTDHNYEVLEAALQAALAEMLEPVGRIKGVHGPDDFCCTREIGFIPMKDEAVFRIRGHQ